MSIFPKRPATSPASLLAASPFDSSAGNAANRGLGKSGAWIERDTPATVAPAARNASVTKLPRPPLAPVIIATLLSRRAISILLIHQKTTLRGTRDRASARRRRKSSGR